MPHEKLHAAEHTDGTDNIQNATASQPGLATAAQIAKLDGIAAGADVTGSNAPQAHAASHTNGTDDIQSATNAQKGLATAAHITALEAATTHSGLTNNPHSTTFLQLGDTPGSYNAGRILYESGAAVVDSAELTYSGTTFKIENTLPIIKLVDTDAALDEKRFYIQASGGDFGIFWENDAQTLVANPVSIAAGTGVVTLSDLTFQAGGATVNTILTSVTASNTALVTSGAVDTALAAKVSTVGTPVDNQIGVWTGNGTLEGDANLTFDGTDLSVVGGFDVTQTGSVAGLYAYRTDGEAVALTAGTTAASFRYDNGGSFRIQSQPRADMNAKNGSNIAEQAEFSPTAISMNSANGDIDFFVRKNTAGDALAYDAGTDAWTLNGTITGAAIKDEDTMVSDSATHLATQQSIKAYVDNQVGGAGDVSKVGTPVDNQIGVWTGDGTIEGDANFTWNGTLLDITGAATLSGVLTNDVGYIDIAEIAAPATPAAGYGRLYVHNDGSGLHFIDDTGKDRHLQAVAYKSEHYPNVTSGTRYALGFYDAAAASAALTQASTTTTRGSSNQPYGAHAFIVTSAAGTASGGTGTVEIEVSGTSITDAGTRTASDTEIILADVTTATANAYYESVKKWIGTVTFTIKNSSGSTHTTYALTFNYGLAKYEDFGNRDIIITDFEVVGRATANDTGFDLELLHHKATGWTYHATAFVPGNGALCKMTTDYGAESDLTNGQRVAYKRSDLSTVVDGSALEGVIVRVTQGTNNSFQGMVHIGAEYN